MITPQVLDKYFRRGMLKARTKLVRRIHRERIALSTEDAESHVWYSRMEEMVSDELPDADILPPPVRPEPEQQPGQWDDEGPKAP